jgi:hypothetical protein
MKGFLLILFGLVIGVFMIVPFTSSNVIGISHGPIRFIIGACYTALAAWIMLVFTPLHLGNKLIAHLAGYVIGFGIMFLFTIFAYGPFSMFTVLIWYVPVLLFTGFISLAFLIKLTDNH